MLINMHQKRSYLSKLFLLNVQCLHVGLNLGKPALVFRLDLFCCCVHFLTVSPHCSSILRQEICAFNLNILYLEH